MAIHCILFYIQSFDLYSFILRENGFNPLDFQPGCVFLEKSGIPMNKFFIDLLIFHSWESYCYEAGKHCVYLQDCCKIGERERGGGVGEWGVLRMFRNVKKKI